MKFQLGKDSLTLLGESAGAGEAKVEMMAEATVKVRVGGKVMHTAAEGNGRVCLISSRIDPMGRDYGQIS